MRASSLAAFSVLLSCSFIASAASAQAVFEALILSGDPAPQTGGSYRSPDDFRMNGSGACSFVSDVAVGSASDGVFLLDASAMQSALALEGGVIPGRTSSAVYSNRFQNIALNEAGDALFSAEDLTQADLLILDSGGVQTLVYDADPGSGMPTGTLERAALNQAGEVAYALGTVGGPRVFVFSLGITREVQLTLPGALAVVAVDALQLGENGRAVAIVRDATLQYVVEEPAMSGPLTPVASQASPAPIGGAPDYASFASLLSRADRTSFSAHLDGFPFDAYFQQDAGGSAQKVAANFDLDSDDAEIGEIRPGSNSLDALGNTCFCTTNAIRARGCYCGSATAGIDRVVAHQNMSLPGGLAFEFGFATATGANGEVAFEASVSQAQVVRRAIFVQHANLDVLPVAEQGQSAPRTDSAELVGNGTLVGVADDTSVFSQWDFDAPEQAIFAGGIALPTVGVGLFRSLPEPGRELALVGALFALSALANLRRVRQRH